MGKVLSNVKYEKEDVATIEKMISTLNSKAVRKSDQLKNLKKQLEKLNRSFEGSGKAEITPFPKKIRDLAKQFTVHFGEDKNNSFSMEYHGMGTRSWASMLTVKAFIDSMANAHKTEVKPFYPILAAEEPEAHLHPNAQRTIYKQLIDSKGQVIISTHSPYLAALASQSEIRLLNITNRKVLVKKINDKLNPEEKRKIQREVIHSRGELFFSKAIILSEGETEEQALPQLFLNYFKEDAFVLGINFVGVGGSGRKYKPFLSFGFDFNIPVFIFSDGEVETVKKLEETYNDIFGETNIYDCDKITILDNTNFEKYLFDSGFESQIEKAIKTVDGVKTIDNWIKKKQGTVMKAQKLEGPKCETCNQEKIQIEHRDYNVKDGRRKAILEILASKKPKYGQAVATQLCKLSAKKLPPKIIEFFEKIKQGMSI